MSTRGHTRVEAIIGFSAMEHLNMFYAREPKFAMQSRSGVRNENGLKSVDGVQLSPYSYRTDNGEFAVYVTYDHFVDNQNGLRARRDFEGFLGVVCPRCKNPKHCMECRIAFSECNVHTIIEYHQSPFTAQPTTSPFRGIRASDIVLGVTTLSADTAVRMA